MFFDDLDSTPRERATLRTLPPTPVTGWKPPTFFPGLNGLVYAGIDWETKERDFDKGPGWARGMSHIVGGAIDLLYRDGSSYNAYYPMRHETDTHLNLDAGQCENFFTDLLLHSCDKGSANMQYEAGNASDMGIKIAGTLHDPQVAEALLTEGGNVALDELGVKYLDIGKESDLGYKWSADAFGGNPTAKQRSNIYRWSPALAGPYAMQDARMVRATLAKQFPMMEHIGVTDIYRMECDFVPLLVDMRRAGVLVNLDKVEQMKGETTREINSKYKELHEMTGLHFSDEDDGASVRSGQSLEKAFIAAGVPYLRTEPSANYPDGQASFRKEWLEALDHPLAELILEIRALLTLRDTFLQSYLLESNINGRVHCQFHSTKGEEKGTRSGRFSSSTPNLQNIPVRSKLGKEIRKCFIPDYGHFGWEKNDYSQIEYRFLAHYAVDRIGGTDRNPIYGDGASSNALRAQYNRDPNTDYHDSTYDRVCDTRGWNKQDDAQRKEWRPKTKNTNFGLVYGMGEGKLARQLKLAMDAAKEFFAGYHTANPYVRATMNATADEAQNNGFITTILGRRSLFELWEPKFTERGQARPMPLPYDRAIREYGYKIKRSSTHKAVNRRLQGSAAELLKMALWKCLKSGLFAVIGPPRLTVHDELDHSVIDDTKEQREGFAELHNVMETAIQLRVPVRVETERGPNWGEVKAA